MSSPAGESSHPTAGDGQKHAFGARHYGPFPFFELAL
jgi:hypothetical protein